MRPALCTSVTYNYLHTALAFARSIRRTWASSPPIFIALVDHVDRPRPGFEDLPGVEFLTLDELEIPSAGWLRCKLSPEEMCCALKPFVMRRLMDLGYDTVFYSDSDIHFFADGQPFLDSLGDGDFLLTPHVLSPPSFHEPWSRPTLGNLSQAGVLNAGMIVARNTPAARAFIDTWSRLCTGPGAFLADLGSQHEQNFFNWVYAFVEKTVLSRDPRVNVAYWNLHERPIRWGGLDGGDATRWYLDDQPIVCFHFSGFAWNELRLSRFDDRARPYVNANLHALCEHYAKELAAAEQAHYAPCPYEFSRFREITLDAGFRTLLKRSEAKGTIPAGDWSSAAPAALTRLNETLSDQSIVPGYLQAVHLRADLAQFHDRVFSREWLRWADLGLWRDHELEGRLYETSCPFVFNRAFLDDLAGEISRADPAMAVADIRHALRTDRPRLIRRLASLDVRSDLGHALEAATYRAPAFVPAIAVRLLYEESEHLRQVFPDVAGEDAEKFSQWVRSAFESIFEVPANVHRALPGFDFEGSVTRVLGRCMRTSSLINDIRRTGLDQSHIAHLNPGAQKSWGYDADDLVVTDWWLTRLGDRALRRVRELLPSEAGEDGFRDYLEAWCERQGVIDASTPAETRSDASVMLEQWLLDDGCPTIEVGHDGVRKRLAAAVAPRPDGVNVFGYFKSPIGLGTATKGLCTALEVAGYPHRDLVIPSDSLEADVGLEDLFPSFAFAYPRNIVVSYPHIDYQLQDVRPRCFFRGRETIGYFAWEQRDFPRAWRARLAPYDRLCALSGFAADSIARGVNRPCDVLPCVVETGPPVPSVVARARFGIPESAFVVGFVFDAASSMERKNPWAFIEAVRKAFGASDDVVIVMKVRSGAAPAFAAQMTELRRRLASACRRSIIIDSDLPKRDVETLLCAMNVYLSLHRSEAFGYTLAEAMLLGVPSVASRYSGNLDFMTDANSWLVDCREVVVETCDGPFQTGTVWAEPDTDHASAILRALYDDYPAAAVRARAAVPDLLSVVSPRAVAKVIATIMEGVPSNQHRDDRRAADAEVVSR